MSLDKISITRHEAYVLRMLWPALHLYANNKATFTFTDLLNLLLPCWLELLKQGIHEHRRQNFRPLLINFKLGDIYISLANGEKFEFSMFFYPF